MELHINKTSLEAGYLLHWYEITKVIGRGGFGITYLAHDNNLDRNVAIKEFMPEEFATRDSDSTVHPKTGEQSKLYDWGLERFITEARTLAKFNHPNIVRVLSVFEENNTAYMVMEYAQGKDLSKIFKKEPKFSEERLLDTFIPILDGLSLVHNAGFIHRDIKPANIYICENNSPLLLDFGSARQSIGSKTKALTSLVTFGYAPFEQYNEGSGKQGPWTDIYSLGASIYFGITEKKPVDALFRGGSFLDKGIDTYEPVSILAKGEYSENFLLAVDKALMFKIDERPSNILDWADMLLGKKQAPELPDYMLNPPQPDDETELSWSDTELGYNTEISRAANSGTQGLVDAHGKRNTDKTLATVVRDTGRSQAPDSGQKPAGDSSRQVTGNNLTHDSAPGEQLSKHWKPLVVAAVAVLFVISFLTWYFSGPSSTETAPATAEQEAKQQAREYEKEKLAQLEHQREKEKQAQQARLDNEARRAKQRLEYLLRQAAQLASAQSYTKPQGESALSYYRQALELDENNISAKQGLQKIENALFKLARSAFNSQKYAEAEAYLSELALINPESEQANDLLDQLKATQDQQKQITSWLADAKAHTKKRRYTSPEKKNAFYVYNKILKLEPENAMALAGIKTIQTYYSAQFKKHISASQLKRAERDITVMKKISAPASTIRSMQKSLETSKKKLLAKTPTKAKTIKPKKLDIQQVSQLISQFKTALEAGDTKKIKQISQFVQGRAQFVEQLHSEYRSIKAGVSNLQLIPKDGRATADIEISQLVDKSGNKVTPGSWSKFEIIIRYNKRNKLRVYW